MYKIKKTRFRGKYLKLQKIVEKELSCSAHNFDHVMRVYNMALRLAREEKEKVDLDILKVATLLHDIGRIKEDDDKTGKVCHAKESAKMSGTILKKMGYCKEKIQKIQHCILTHRYKTNKKSQIIEANILFDADKLDSLGAIVIMRAGMWLGRNNGTIFPQMKLKDYVRYNLEGEKANGRIKDTSKHSFYYEYELKVKKLPELMYTKTGIKIAKQRLKFIDKFLDRLEKEAKGEL